MRRGFAIGTMQSPEQDGHTEGTNQSQPSPDMQSSEIVPEAGRDSHSRPASPFHCCWPWSHTRGGRTGTEKECTRAPIGPPTSLRTLEFEMGTVSGAVFDDEMDRVSSSHSPKPTIRTTREQDLVDAFSCPISNSLMKDPVIAPDGYSYERSRIVRWIHQKRSSPMTGKRFPYPVIIPNHTLRHAIQKFVEGTAPD